MVAAVFTFATPPDTGRIINFTVAPVRLIGVTTPSLVCLSVASSGGQVSFCLMLNFGLAIVDVLERREGRIDLCKCGVIGRQGLSKGTALDDASGPCSGLHEGATVLCSYARQVGHDLRVGTPRHKARHKRQPQHRRRNALK